MALPSKEEEGQTDGKPELNSWETATGPERRRKRERSRLFVFPEAVVSIHVGKEWAAHSSLETIILAGFWCEGGSRNAAEGQGDDRGLFRYFAILIGSSPSRGRRKEMPCANNFLRHQKVHKRKQKAPSSPLLILGLMQVHPR
jgi:hypothetical protein